MSGRCPTNRYGGRDGRRFRFVIRPRSAVDRMGVYAALGVPEVWRCDGVTPRANLLQPDGGWQESEYSPTFPKIPLADIVPFLQPSEAVDYLGMVRAFRAWIVEQRTHS